VRDDRALQLQRRCYPFGFKKESSAGPDLDRNRQDDAYEGDRSGNKLRHLINGTAAIPC
jgi:hypothetical protein